MCLRIVLLLGGTLLTLVNLTVPYSLLVTDYKNGKKRQGHETQRKVMTDSAESSGDS